MAHYMALGVYFQEPNWIVTTIIGAIVGALVASYGKVITYPLRRLRKDPIEGEWREYHLSYLSNAVVLRKCLLTIEKGLIQDRVVRFVHLDQSNATNSDLRYFGTVKKEIGHFILSLTGTTHEETLMYRFTSRIPSNYDLIPGLWLSYDHDLKPASGAAILSRKELADSQALEILKDRVTGGASGVMRII